MGPHSCPSSYHGHMGEVRFALTALEGRGAAKPQALSPSAGQSGCISALSHSTTGVEVESELPSLATPAAGMSDPSRSAILLFWACFGGDARFPRFALHFSAFLGHRGPP